MTATARISVDHRQHKGFERDVASYLESLGILTEKAGYHDVYKDRPDVIRLLQFMNDPTSLGIRGRHDRIAICPSFSFKWEVKTNSDWGHENWAIEVLPLAKHISMAKVFREKCLYVYRDEIRNFECGFWVDNPPPVDCIIIPGRWNQKERTRFKSVFRECFPQAFIRDTGSTRGSGDPFGLILASEVKILPDWKLLVNNALATPLD